MSMADRIYVNYVPMLNKEKPVQLCSRKTRRSGAMLWPLVLGQQQAAPRCIAVGGRYSASSIHR